MLSQHLKELEKDGLVRRTSFPEIPPKVVYSITAKGRSLKPVFMALEAWGLQNIRGVCSIAEMTEEIPIPEP